MQSSKGLAAVSFFIAFVLAFAVHYWVQSIDGVSDTAEAGATRHSPEWLLQEMKDNVTDLEEIAKTPREQTKEPDPAEQLISEIDAAMQAILDDTLDEPEAKVVADARLAQVQAYFFAAGRQPQVYREQFDALSTQLMQDFPETTLAIEASMLSFCADHDLTAPIKISGLHALSKQADSYSNEIHGAALFCFVSRKLHAYGQRQSAKLVLDAGMAKYQGKTGSQLLYDQYADQGHLSQRQPRTRSTVVKSRTLRRGNKQKSKTNADVDPLFAAGQEMLEMQARHEEEMRRSNKEFIQRARKELVEDGYTYFEQSLDGNEPVVHVRNGKAMPYPKN